jgi:cobalamin biosynthesis protein CobT
MRAVQEAMGHEDPRTTALYTQLSSYTQTDTRHRINGLMERLRINWERNKMDLQSVVKRYEDRLEARFGSSLSRDQWSAFNAIEGCRQGAYGHLILLHVLPKGFRRARDHSFLHANARALLNVVQSVFLTPGLQKKYAKSNKQ